MKENAYKRHVSQWSPNVLGPVWAQLLGAFGITNYNEALCGEDLKVAYNKAYETLVSKHPNQMYPNWDTRCAYFSQYVSHDLFNTENNILPQYNQNTCVLDLVGKTISRDMCNENAFDDQGRRIMSEQYFNTVRDCLSAQDSKDDIKFFSYFINGWKYSENDLGMINSLSHTPIRLTQGKLTYKLCDYKQIVLLKVWRKTVGSMILFRPDNVPEVAIICSPEDARQKGLDVDREYTINYYELINPTYSKSLSMSLAYYQGLVGHVVKANNFILRDGSLKTAENTNRPDIVAIVGGMSLGDFVNTNQKIKQTIEQRKK